jgi:hypothetical protein
MRNDLKKRKCLKFEEIRAEQFHYLLPRGMWEVLQWPPCMTSVSIAPVSNTLVTPVFFGALSAVLRIFWSGSGSADLCLCLMDPVPDPSIFIIDLQDANKKQIKKKKKKFCILLFEGTFTSFFKSKKLKRSHKTVEIKVFLTILLDVRRTQIRIYNHTSD